VLAVLEKKRRVPLRPHTKSEFDFKKRWVGRKGTWWRHRAKGQEIRGIELP